MGQYYVIANLDKKEYLLPHDFGNGAKLMEFGLDSFGVMSGLAILLASSNGCGGGDLFIEEGSPWEWVPGHWAGDRVVIAGDYDQTPDSPGCGVYREAQEDETPMEVLASELGPNPKGPAWMNISKDVIAALGEDPYARKHIVAALKSQWSYSRSAKDVWKHMRKPEEPESLV